MSQNIQEVCEEVDEHEFTFDSIVALIIGTFAILFGALCVVAYFLNLVVVLKFIAAFVGVLMFISGVILFMVGIRNEL